MIAKEMLTYTMHCIVCNHHLCYLSLNYMIYHCAANVTTHQRQPGNVITILLSTLFSASASTCTEGITLAPVSQRMH